MKLAGGQQFLAFDKGKLAQVEGRMEKWLGGLISCELSIFSF
jgi:hypothetical protein